MAIGQRAGSTSCTCGLAAFGGAPDREGHHAAAVQEQQPADRPAEEQFAACRPRACASQCICFGKREVPQEHASAAPATRRRCSGRADCLRIGEVFPFGVCTRSSASNSTPCFLRKAQRRRRRLSVGVERRRHGRAGEGLVEVFLALGDASRCARSAAAAWCSSRRRAGRDPQLLRGAPQPAPPAARVSPGSQDAGSSSTPISISSSLSINLH